MRAGKEHGLKPKVHADQFRDRGGAKLAARVRATSVEHVDATGLGGIHALRKAGVVPVLPALRRASSRGSSTSRTHAG